MNPNDYQTVTNVSSNNVGENRTETDDSNILKESMTFASSGDRNTSIGGTATQINNNEVNKSEGLSSGSAEGTFNAHPVSFLRPIKSNDNSTKHNQLHRLSNASLKNPRKASTSSISTYSTSLLKPGNTPGNRTSILSNYSGIVQNLDIDTIKYVGNKNSLQLSDLNTVSSSDEDVLVMHSPTGSFKSHSSLKPQNESPLKSQNALLNNESMVKLIRNKVDNSPNKPNMSPPKSPLPKLNNTTPVRSPSPSPLRKRGNRHSATSVSSRSSSQLHGQLDDIMKEVQDLNLNIRDDNLNEERETDNKKSLSLTSSTSYNTGAHSFHTANSKEDSFTNAEFEDFHTSNNDPNESSGEGTRELNVPVFTLDPSKQREDQETLQATPPSILRQNSDSSKSKKKSSTSNRRSKSSSGNGKSKRKRDSKNKIKPFSYETLAKLLNATDGIIIGQEFATLDIPTEEKFLIERIVDSISRLTANMIINPARYDQSCARLERVLNVLEGFD